MASYSFGVEIELIMEPRDVHFPHSPRVYYNKLASSLRYNGAAAIADTLDRRYRKHPEHYDKWWITKDGSLGDPDFPSIPLEVVSPILSTRHRWADDIDTFWTACRTVFYRPERSQLCGSHIHVSLGRQRKFDLHKLRALAFGVLYYERAVYSLLPSCRQTNRYCQLNSERSEALRALENFFGSDGQATWAARAGIQEIDNLQELRDFMQKSPNPETDRHVLWNFDNILPGRSGTVEFRGGEGLEDPVRTKTWIAFVVAFVHLCVTKRADTFDHSERTNMTQFWGDLLNAAEIVMVREHLPSSWQEMASSSGPCYAGGGSPPLLPPLFPPLPEVPPPLFLPPPPLLPPSYYPDGGGPWPPPSPDPYPCVLMPPQAWYWTCSYPFPWQQ